MTTFKDLDLWSYRAKIVKNFLKRGASLKRYAKENYKLSNPLHWACFHGDY